MEIFPRAASDFFRAAIFFPNSFFFPPPRLAPSSPLFSESGLPVFFPPIYGIKEGAEKLVMSAFC
jgi:hypothetical protein